MTQTPWGEADQLRLRQLRPGFRLPREDVERNQRWRLLGAMVAVVAERGYEATTVADLVALSGVSRTAFYRLFANKEECFVAAVDEIVDYTTGVVAEAWRQEAPWDERLQAAFEAFVGEVVTQPAAARMCFLDVYVAGPAAVDHADQATATFERMVRQSLDESPERTGMPPLLVRAIVGGIRKVIFTRLRRGETASLPSIVPELWEWAIGYTAPPVPLRQPKVRAAPAPSTRFVAHDQVERICAAMAEVTARNGYAATRIEDVVATASASLSTFYGNFETKEEAFLAAYDVGLAQAFAASLPSFQRASDWRHGVRALADAMLSYLSAEPAWARMGIVETLAAGPRGMERRDDAIATYAALLQPGFDEAPGVPEIAAEAIGGGIYALIYDHIRRKGTDQLLELQPAATYFGLAPFVGSEEAVAIANARGRRGNRTSAASRG